MFDNMKDFPNISTGTCNVNTEINGVRTERICEKAGEIFGEKGKKIGGFIDDMTDWLTIKIDI